MRWLSRRQLLTVTGCLFVRYLSGWTSVALGGAKKNSYAPVRFGVLCDPHIEVNGINNWMLGESSLLCLSATVCALNTLELDFVLIPGDLLNRNVPENLVQAKSILDTLTHPYYVVAGNHDYPTANSGRQQFKDEAAAISHFIKTFSGHGYDGSSRRYWACRLGNGLRLIALDGCLAGETVKYGGYLPKSQIKWLEAQLAEHPDDLHLVMLHHNLVYWGNDSRSREGRWFSLDNSEEVRNVLESYRENVGLVVSGHRHIGLRRKRLNNINYFTLPSINSHPMNFTVFELNNNELRWKSVPVPVDRSLHSTAKSLLLKAPWIESLNQMTRDEIVVFYENNQQQVGRFQL